MHDINQLSKHKHLLQELAHADFFDVDLQDDVLGVAEICQCVIENPNIIPETDLQKFSYAVSRFCLHLEGSIKDELPTAIDYCMQHAISDWFISEKVTILHACTNEKGFYCSPYLWDFLLYIKESVKPALQLSPHHVFVGAPRVFKNTTLFLPILFHEIGHWVDKLWGISSALRNAESDNIKTFAYEKHYNEHFADFFAACYIGETVAEILEILSQNEEESETHPVTATRVEFIRKFVRGEEFKELMVFQNHLKARELPEFKQRFAAPNISSSFDFARPHRIQDVAELHGILTSAWNYHNEINAGRSVEWPTQLTNYDRIEVVSRLLEKSIMNFAMSNNRQQQSNDQSGAQLKETDLQGMSIAPLLEEDQIAGNAVELRLGCDFKLSILGQNPVNVPETDLDDEFALAKYFLSTSREMGGKFTLYPNQVLLATTVEYLTLPDNRCGKLTVLDCQPNLRIATASTVRPGFNGCIPLQLKNFGDEPIDIVIGERMVQLELINPNGTQMPGGIGPEQFVLVKPKPSRIAADKEFMVHNSPN